ncbi:MAG: prolyl oligopeptidase family serine peptidase [Acidobacteriota bacterium]|nr:prolyl oligopeptidase family serine peptidase [Acidobacteriota bacterium]
MNSARRALLAVLIVMFAVEGLAAEVDEGPSLEISEWLVLGPLQSTIPAFDDLGAGDALGELLETATLPEIRRLPADGDQIEGFSGPVAWRKIALEGVSIQLEKPTWARDRRVAVAWLSTSIRTKRFVTAGIEVECEHPWKVMLDGKTVASGDLEFDLEPGDHVLYLATIFEPEIDGPWAVSVAVTTEIKGAVSANLRRERELDIMDVLDAATVTAFELSPSGDRVVLSLARVRAGSDEREIWVELRSTTDGALLRSWRGAPSMTEVRFAPTGNRISYVTREGDTKTATLWVNDLESGTTSEIVAGIENWDSYLWSPNGATIAFSTTEKPEENESGIKRLRGLLDRMADHRNLTVLHLVNVSSGVRKQLTGGALSASPASFSPDGSKILVTREVEDLSRRPYSRNELWEITLANGDERKLRDFWWLGGVEYAPDGGRLLIQAGPSEFGETGIAVGGGGPVNDYDGQLYLWDPDSGAVDAISRSFDPAITSARWSRHDGRITVLAVDGHRRSLFRYEPNDGMFTPIPTGMESIGSFDIATNGPTVIAEGTSVWQAQRVVVAGADDRPARLLVEPSSDRFSVVRSGDVREWNFTSTDGRGVAGRIYYPTTFTSGTSYPAIVNYYGGTSPMNRSFGGRYPAEWWAANGYVVYVLTPTGAYGWGQEASTVHVNDWGEVTSRQIIEATTAFLDAHPFVDRQRVGCIGASYGGFMTMKLVTETDLFAAAVAHAGISALSSYWGEGYWGYSYGAVANADSFPWNRRDIFVDRSPLFSADKVTTPVLLTHGDEDPNVPPGESDQFYAALKLLGVEVEYLRVAGLGHLIMEHDKRALWSKSIVAWFDRLLKDQPEWWQALYAEE